MKKENPFVKFIRILLIIILSPFLLVYIICRKIKLAKKRKMEQNFIKICTISQINALSGAEFEIFLKKLFLAMGYDVTLTKTSKDFGADLIIRKGKHIYIVQAKRYNHTVGIGAVQEIISARAHYGVYGAIVVTSSEFSKEAQTLAKENDIMLADRTVLEGLIQKFEVKIDPSAKQARTLSENDILEINQRYHYWI